MKPTRFLLGPSVLLIALGSVACSQSSSPPKTVAQNTTDTGRTVDEETRQQNTEQRKERTEESGQDTSESPVKPGYTGEPYQDPMFRSPNY